MLGIDQLARTVDMMRGTQLPRHRRLAGSQTDLARLLDRVVSGPPGRWGGRRHAACPATKGALLPAMPDSSAQPHASVLPVPEVEAGSPIARAFASGSTVVATIAPGSGGALAFLSELWPESPSC